MILKKIFMLQHHCDNKGFVFLLSVLIVTVMATSITIAILSLGIGSSRTSFARLQSSQARALADGCAEEALQQIKDNPSYSGTDSLSLGQGSCEYSIEILEGESRAINSSSDVTGAVRKVKVQVSSITPQIVISSWQEVLSF